MDVRPLALVALVALLALVCAGPAAAQPLAAAPDCGGDAYSSAQVVEGRPPRRGPVTAVPDTLCADLAPGGAPAGVRIDVYPAVPQVGSGGGAVPYGGGPPRLRRP